MKKLLLYFLLVILLIFCLPIVFTNPFESEEVIADEVMIQNIIEEEKFDYGEYSNIQLLHVASGEVENLDLDTYLYGVVSAEMPASYELEALKAQAVVARTYTIFKIKNGSKHVNADICDDSTCCQAWITKENRMARWEEDKREGYWKKIVTAVNQTKGKIAMYNGQPINAFFHSNSGGKTELPINVWGGTYPYLQVVSTTGEDAYTTYNSEIILSKDELIQKMLEKNSKFEIDFEEKECIKIMEYTEGERVKKIKVGNIELSGVEARTILGLKSAKFKFEVFKDNIKFSVVGYGHGVGLSQSGSDALAKQGKKYEEIIKYYYKDVEISE